MPYPLEQIQTLYKKLPPELQKALFSEETAQVISDACNKYGIEDERIGQIAKHVGDVLSGFILPSELENALRENVKMPPVLVRPIANEINRFIFFPVKAQLEMLHPNSPNVGVATPRHSDRGSEYFAEPQEETTEKPAVSEEQEAPDQYRESIG